MLIYQRRKIDFVGKPSWESRALHHIHSIKLLKDINMLNRTFDMYKSAMEAVNNALLKKWSKKKKSVKLSLELDEVVN